MLHQEYGSKLLIMACSNQTATKIFLFCQLNVLLFFLFSSVLLWFSSLLFAFHFIVGTNDESCTIKIQDIYKSKTHNDQEEEKKNEKRKEIKTEQQTKKRNYTQRVVIQTAVDVFNNYLNARTLLSVYSLSSRPIMFICNFVGLFICLYSWRCNCNQVKCTIDEINGKKTGKKKSKQSS